MAYTHSRYKAADIPVPPDRDSASSAFQGQVDALRKAEAHVAQAATQPQHGLTPRQQAFLDANPEMLDEPERLSKALLQAHEQGFEPDSPAFHEAVGHNWRAHHVTIAAENTASLHHPPGSPEHQRETHRHVDRMLDDLNDKPVVKRHKEYTSEPSRDMGRRVQAPVTRGAGGGGSYTSGGERHGRVTLSAEQKHAAAISGVSLEEYARQLLRLKEAKANGDYQGRP